MKKIILIFISLALLSSCSNRHSAKRVARQFLQSYYLDFNFETAKRLSTQETHTNLEQRMLLIEHNPFFREEQAINDVKITNVDVRKTKAVCTYIVGGSQRRLNLNKVDGVWLVDMPQADFLDPALSLGAPIVTGGMAMAESAPIRMSDLRREDSIRNANASSND